MSEARRVEIRGDWPFYRLQGVMWVGGHIPPSEIAAGEVWQRFDGEHYRWTGSGWLWLMDGDTELPVGFPGLETYRVGNVGVTNLVWVDDASWE